MKIIGIKRQMTREKMLSHTPKSIGDKHKRKIFQALLEYGPMSRADLARLLELSPPAITTNINSLIDSDILMEIGVGESEIGRKPVLININRQYRHLIGVDINEESIIILLSDFSGEVIDTYEYTALPGEKAQAVITQITMGVAEIMKRNDPQIIIGLAVISVPGIVDKKTDSVELSSVVHGWPKEKVTQIFSELLNMPVCIENDVDMAFSGEYILKEYSDVSNMVYIKSGGGLAARLLINGKPCVGHNNTAGEIGFMLMSDSTVRDSFSVRGWLEDKTCNHSLDLRYRQISSQASDEYYGFLRLSEMARKGDPAATQIIDETLMMLARAIVNISAILDTEVIVLGGEFESLKQ